MVCVRIDVEACKSCGLCVRACPKKIIRIAEEGANLKGFYPAECFDMEKCIACRACALTCPDACIEIEKE